MARILGRDRMRKVLKALPKTVRAELRRGILEAAEKVADDQRSLAPVRTGALRDSIKVTPGDENLPLYASLKSRRTEKDPELSAIITAGNTKVRYAHLVEFGTAPHINQGEFPGTSNPGAPAEPFFYPAFRAGKRKAQATINKAARKGIVEGLK
jgi:HK97 gp10 family phage protein